ncbi:MAG: beta-galactosidase [Nibricoccus sp.]
MSVTPFKSLAPKLPPGILYGGDYNPEQWPEEVWQEDVRLMREAGVNFVSLAIFSWAKLEPREGEFTFGWLDKIIELLWKNDVSINLASATASPPAWFSRAHPESLPVDENGARLSIGSRQHYCPNSRAYRQASARLCKKLAGRYASHPAVALWHLNNEIGCHSHTCYCDVCASEFRTWLKNRYGTLEILNEKWGTAFWSQAYGDWKEIQPPRKMMTFRNPGQVLDYSRFMNHALREILLGEIAAVCETAPDAKVTTNGLGFWRQTDYFSWYKHVDIAAWDSYPDPTTGFADIRTAAFGHDLFRSLKGGQPFILMEQVTSQVNWRAINALKAPNQMRALSYQAIAHGADGVMFFQWRASKAGAEKFHGAMVPHFGSDGRVFAEVRNLGQELKKLSPLLGSRVKAPVAIVVSWENRWALELESKPMQFDYASILGDFYRPLWELNVGVDVVSPDAPLDNYTVVIAPTLYQITQHQSDRLKSYVEKGGCLLMSYFSGVADEHDHIWLGGYPAALKDVFGIVVEEWQPLPAESTMGLSLSGGSGTFRSSKFCEILHLRGAQALAQYTETFLAGKPAITSNSFGEGEAIYVAAHAEHALLKKLFEKIFAPRALTAPCEVSPGVELTVRQGAAEEFLFVVNNDATAARIDYGHWRGTDLLTGRQCEGEEALDGFAVRVIRRSIDSQR